MEIKKLQIQNFEGFSGIFEYEFKDKINALCLRNGAGKTSFLDALRYGITGVKPDGNPINIDYDNMAVGLTFHDGMRVIRQEFTNKSSRSFMNGRPVNKRELDDALQTRAGVAQSTMKVATSTDVLAGLKPQEFGELLLSYIPETLTAEEIINMLGTLTNDEIAEIREFFPETTFGMDYIDAFYKQMSEKRKNVKKKIDMCNGFLDKFKGMAPSEKSEEELTKELEDLNLKKSTVDIYKEQLKNYNDTLKRAEQWEKDVAQRKADIAAIKEDKYDSALKEKLEKELEEVQAVIDEVNRVYSTLSHLVKTQEKSLEDLEKPICPLSEKLKCTTDKSVIRKELEDSIADGKKEMENQYKKGEKADKRRTEIKNEIKKCDDAKASSDKKDFLNKELEKLLANPVNRPKEPEKIDVKDYSAEIKRIVDAISIAKSTKEIEDTKVYIVEKQKKLDTYDHLVKLFAPKGEVKEKIAEYYIAAFEEECNEKAEELKPGMKVKFISNAGISVYTDINGDGNFVDFKSLSGGEKAYVLFILLDMINSLTGLKMMFLDELSVLDKDAFETLLKLMIEHSEDYDLVIMAMAEHDDCIKILKDNNVNMIDLAIKEEDE